MPSSILFVHQGFELYGSDRTLIQSVQAAASCWPTARITVLITSDGLLRAALLAIVDDVRVVDLAIIRKSNLKKMRLKGVRSLAAKVVAARRMMRDYEVTYINTVVVMDYILAKAITRGLCVIHIHEIPSKIAAFLFSGLLAFSGAHLLFNSLATRRSFRLVPWQHRAIVWNGVAAPPARRPAAPDGNLHLLMIGRINAWKGQAILLRAVATLPPALRCRVRVRVVGSVFGAQDHFARGLNETLSEHGLSDVVEMLPFAPEPGPHYNWADVVVVPSTRPEPFGLVAIEGMAAGKSILAANHGGIAEIVIDGVTGTLVAPGSVVELAAAITSYLRDPQRIRTEGEAGRERYLKYFEESHYKSKIVRIISEMSEHSGAAGLEAGARA